MATTSENSARPEGLAHRLITWWALFGGAVLVGVVLINTWSILAGAVIGRPFPGDFELTELGAAVAAFCFLPYCQLVGANVSADIFTMRAGPLSLALMSVLSAVVAALFALILFWRMSAGMQDYREFEEFTGILQIPIWWVFVPALISLALLFLAATLSFRDALFDLGTARGRDG